VYVRSRMRNSTEFARKVVEVYAVGSGVAKDVLDPLRTKALVNLDVWIACWNQWVLVGTNILWRWRHVGSSSIAINVEFFWNGKWSVELFILVLVSLDMVKHEIKLLEVLKLVRDHRKNGVIISNCLLWVEALVVLIDTCDDSSIVTENMNWARADNGKGVKAGVLLKKAEHGVYTVGLRKSRVDIRDGRWNITFTCPEILRGPYGPSTRAVP